jgi:polysaccharide biosynthesis/export protein
MSSIRLIRFSLVAIIVIQATSCITYNKLSYLQHDASAADSIRTIQPKDYRIQLYDNVYIKVSTPDPQWSEMFNTLRTSEANSSLSEQSADLISYSVNNEGYIYIPFVGKYEAAGKTLLVVKNELEQLLKAYVTDASVTVKMVNNYVSILGEVKSPGKYPIYKERLTIFQALAMAGDLAEYSNRNKIQVIRQVDSITVVKEYSLTDRKIISSEFYYVMPNDVIYSEPMKGKFFQMNAFPYGVILTSVTTFILFLNVLK